MNRHTHLFAVTISCSVVFAATVMASEPLDLAHNPFARPPSEQTGPQLAPYTNSDGSIPVLDLRATMVGTRDRLANVGGRVIRPGDEIQGYTLLKVHEDRALFSRQGKQETIYVKPDPVEDDE